MRVFITSSHGFLYEFDLADKFQPGDQIGEAEAAALNRLVSENISRNRTAWVRRLEGATGERLLAIEDLKTCLEELQQYAQTYQLVPVPSDRRGDIEREAELVRAERSCKDCDYEAETCLGCLNEGRRRVLVKAGIAQRALADL